jgi:hypothetical protein
MCFALASRVAEQAECITLVGQGIKHERQRKVV